MIEPPDRIENVYKYLRCVYARAYWKVFLRTRAVTWIILLIMACPVHVLRFINTISFIHKVYSL